MGLERSLVVADDGMVVVSADILLAEMGFTMGVICGRIRVDSMADFFSQIMRYGLGLMVERGNARNGGIHRWRCP